MPCKNWQELIDTDSSAVVSSFTGKTLIFLEHCETKERNLMSFHFKSYIKLTWPTALTDFKGGRSNKMTLNKRPRGKKMRIGFVIIIKLQSVKMENFFFLVSIVVFLFSPAFWEEIGDVVEATQHNEISNSRVKKTTQESKNFRMKKKCNVCMNNNNNDQIGFFFVILFFLASM